MMVRSDYFTGNSFGGLEDLSHDMERVFDSLLGRTVGTIMRGGNNSEKYVPTLDVSETEDAYSVSLDLPGVNPDDVKIEMHDGKLTISGNRASAVDEEGKNYHRVERSSGTFFRAVSLPGEIDVENIDANYEHGVLHIKLAKVAKQQPKKIQIRTTG